MLNTGGSKTVSIVVPADMVLVGIDWAAGFLTSSYTATQIVAAQVSLQSTFQDLVNDAANVLSSLRSMFNGVAGTTNVAWDWNVNKYVALPAVEIAGGTTVFLHTNIGSFCNARIEVNLFFRNPNHVVRDTPILRQAKRVAPQHFQIPSLEILDSIALSGRQAYEAVTDMVGVLLEIGSIVAINESIFNSLLNQLLGNSLSARALIDIVSNWFAVGRPALQSASIFHSDNYGNPVTPDQDVLSYLTLPPLLTLDQVTTSGVQQTVNVVYSRSWQQRNPRRRRHRLREFSSEFPRPFPPQYSK